MMGNGNIIRGMAKVKRSTQVETLKGRHTLENGRLTSAMVKVSLYGAAETFMKVNSKKIV